LIDLVSKEVTYLPPISASLSRPADYNEFSGYSFISEGELVLTDPYYYLSKFRKSIYKSSLSFLTPSPSVTRLGDTGIRMDPGSFSGIKAPDVSNILSYKLHLQELKFIFIGQKLKTGEKVLMVFDFNEKKFSQIDVGVSRFDLAPDGNSICYTKALGGSDHLQAIYTAGVSGENKKELAQHAEIRSFTWSTDSQWVAYSGGSPSNCDIFVAKSDGSKQEQLTHNIFAADKLAWKGNKLAFTSDGGKSPELPSIYLITLNVQNVENPPPTAAYPKNPQLAYQLISFLRAETSIHLNKKSGT
ncbi:MAG: hypothetical protein N2484_06070, partial [Clostridia bacterium]|nr:hypothetical protein [Clostridia bacterium]